MYKIIQFSGKQKDYYRMSGLFLAYVDSRKYKDVLTVATTIPGEDYPAVKSETDDAIQAQNADILVKSRKAMSEILTAVEKISVCFLQVSCAENTKKCG